MSGKNASPDDDDAATDGEEYIKKLLNKENIAESPAYLLFTAPYRICEGGCRRGHDTNLAMAFPLFGGNYGKTVYKEIYPNNSIIQGGNIFRTKPPRVPYTTCSTAKRTFNPRTRSTGYPGYSFTMPNTPSTGYPGYDPSTRKTLSTGKPNYNEEVNTDVPKRDKLRMTLRDRLLGYAASQETEEKDFLNYIEFRKTLKSSFLDHNAFRNTQGSGLPNYAAFRTRKLDSLHNNPIRVTRSANWFKENEANPTIQNKQENNIGNADTSNGCSPKIQQVSTSAIVLMVLCRFNLIPAEQPPWDRWVLDINSEPKMSRRHNIVWAPENKPYEALNFACKCPPNNECKLDFEVDEKALDFLKMHGVLKKHEEAQIKSHIMAAKRRSNSNLMLRGRNSRRNNAGKLQEPCCCPPENIL